MNPLFRSLLRQALSVDKLDIVVEEELQIPALSWAGSAGHNWQRNYIFLKLEKKVGA